MAERPSAPVPTDDAPAPPGPVQEFLTARPTKPAGPGGGPAPAAADVWAGSSPPRGRSGAGTDKVLALLARVGGVTILLMMAALLVVLFVNSLPSLKKFGFGFLASRSWKPNAEDTPAAEHKIAKKDARGRLIKDEDGQVIFEIIKEPPRPVEKPTAAFGALPVIWGTAISSAIALVLAVPLSFGAALFLVRIAPRYVVAPVSFLIEFLAAIPSVAYGIWGLFVLAPFLQNHVEPALNGFFDRVPGLGWLHYEGLTGKDMFCAGLVLTIMILPIITAVSRDVLKTVPRVQIEGSLALGATWWQSCWEMLRYSRSGLFGGIMLGLARAAGETMAVTMVIGNDMHIHTSPFGPSQTMASLLATQYPNPVSVDHRSALLEVALILLVMSLLFNVVARWLVVGRNANTAAAA